MTNPLTSLWIAALYLAVGYPRAIDWDSWPRDYVSRWKA